MHGSLNVSLWIIIFVNFLIFYQCYGGYNYNVFNHYPMSGKQLLFVTIFYCNWTIIYNSHRYFVYKSKNMI